MFEGASEGTYQKLTEFKPSHEQQHDQQAVILLLDRLQKRPKTFSLPSSGAA